MEVFAKILQAITDRVTHIVTRLDSGEGKRQHEPLSDLTVDQSNLELQPSGLTGRSKTQ